MPKVGIIIINYKDYANRFLADCRDSLEKQSFPRDQYKVYIVDNASSDETMKYLQESYPEAMILPRPDGNYTAGNNRGAKQAIKDGCELLVMANMDVKFDVDWLKYLVETVEADDKIGLAQSKILLYPKSEQEQADPLINSVGNKLHFLGFGFTDGYNLPNSSIKLENDKEIHGYASGCSFIIKKEVFEAIGGYDEEYYMYHDDIEVGSKTKLAGYKSMLSVKSVIYHKYEFSRSVRMLFYLERNRYIWLLTFRSLPTLILIFPAMLVMEIGMVLYSLANGWFGTKLKIYNYFLQAASWRKIVRSRKKLEKIRRISEFKSVQDLVGKILFQEIANPVLEKVVNPALNIYWRVIKKIIIW